VEEVCAALGIGRTRFYELPERALYGALEALFSGPPGPRPRTVDAREQRILELEAALSQLQIQLQASRVRTEIALVMPHILRQGHGLSTSGSCDQTEFLHCSATPQDLAKATASVSTSVSHRGLWRSQPRREGNQIHPLPHWQRARASSGCNRRIPAEFNRHQQAWLPGPW
jgi:hypothetical protein